MYGTRNWWKNVKSATGTCNSNAQAPYVHIDGEWLDVEQFSEKLNEYYVSIGGDAEFTIPIIPSTTNIRNIEEISVWEVYNSLKQINTRKSTHSKDYPSWVTKNNAELLAEPICSIINSVLATGTYPAIWKEAEITPIPKTKKPSTYKDFRPISLLYHLSKITETFINKQLSEHICEDNDQYAYTKGIGTTDALVKFITDIASILDNKHMYAVQSLYLDFSKAFDLMRPDVLATKLINQQADPRLINLMMDFLTNRSQKVKISNTVSNPLNTRLGVPQGTISGPNLWKVYVSDLKPSAMTLKYADDTTVYSEVRKSDIIVNEKCGRERVISLCNNNMQSATDNAVQWSMENHQRLNAGKTQFMMFSLQLKTKLHDAISIAGENIQQTETARLLGVEIDQHLKFAHHVENIVSRSRQAIHGLLTLKRKGVTPSMLTKYYQTCIFPILSYACPAWHSYLSQESRDRLERHQSLCLRLIHPHTQSYTERLQRSNISKINDVLLQQCKKYANKIANDTRHRLHHLVPPKQSARGRHSSRLADRYSQTARTAKMCQNVFNLL